MASLPHKKMPEGLVDGRKMLRIHLPRRCVVPLAVVAFCHVSMSLAGEADSTNSLDRGWLSPNVTPASVFSSETEALFAQSESEPYVPESADELFGLPAEPGDAETADDLFGLTEDPEQTGFLGGLQWGGFYQFGLAYTYPSPSHWSKIRNTLEVGVSDTVSENFRWRATGRFVFDAVYALTDFYPQNVKGDQEFEASVRETYADVSSGKLDFRLGRQQVVWGDVLGVFVADVVSAKDFRNFIVEDFDLIRIPQWAARAEYFGGELAGGEFYGDALWIPAQTVDDIGVPGSEFYPFRPVVPPGFNSLILSDADVPVTFSNSGGGVRANYLKGGWDTSLFYYTSIGARGAFQRTFVPNSNGFTFQRVFDRIHQVGATVNNDFGSFVFHAEAVYTADRLWESVNPFDPDGLVRQDSLDYMLGIDYVLPRNTRFNVQFLQTWFPGHDPSIIPDEVESAVTLYLSTEAIHPKLEPSVLWIRNLNRDDWLLRLRTQYEIQQNLWVAVGADIFTGPPLGVFGRFEANDRVYSELRFSF